jgi:hypothetical protein
MVSDKGIGEEKKEAVVVHFGVRSHLPGQTELKQREISVTSNIALSWTAAEPEIPRIRNRNAMHSATTTGQETHKILPRRTY